MTKATIYAVRKNLLTDQPAVIVWDEVGRRFFNIWIQKMEGLVIAMGLTGITAPRPMAIHFLANIMKATGVQLEEVHIEAFKDNIFYAVAKVRNGELVRNIDARPSDALGLAMLMDCPIFVAEEVFEQVGIVLPEDMCVDRFLAEQFLKCEGITLPEGKTLQFTHDKEQQRAAVLKEMEELLNPSKQKEPPTAEDQERAKQRYLASLMGEDA